MVDMVVWISVTKSDMSVPCFVGREQSLWWYRSWRTGRQMCCALFCDALFCDCRAKVRALCRRFVGRSHGEVTRGERVVAEEGIVG